MNGKEDNKPVTKGLPKHMGEWEQTILTATKRAKSQEHQGQPAAGACQGLQQTREYHTFTTPSQNPLEMGDESERKTSYWWRNVNRGNILRWWGSEENCLPRNGSLSSAGRAWKESDGRNTVNYVVKDREIIQSKDLVFIAEAKWISFTQRSLMWAYCIPGTLARTESTQWTKWSPCPHWAHITEENRW